jgi:hypothetical protein
MYSWLWLPMRNRKVCRAHLLASLVTSRVLSSDQKAAKHPRIVVSDEQQKAPFYGQLIAQSR